MEILSADTLANLLTAFTLLNAPTINNDDPGVNDPGVLSMAQVLCVAEGVPARWLLDTYADPCGKKRMEIARGYYQEMRHCPPPEDAQWLLPKEAVDGFIEFTDAYLEHLQSQQAMDWSFRYTHWQEMITETQYRKRIYRQVQLVHLASYSYQQRLELRDLRDLLGERLYYSRQLPYNVPVHMFRETR